MTEKLELLPCPFCGGAPNKEPEDNGIGCYWIICDNVSDGCGCEGPYKHCKEDAAHAWNRRAAPASAAEPVKVKFGDMPSYGRATGNNLLAAVHAAIYGRGEVKFAEINDDHPLWHQMVPTINFDSLNRIVTAFVNGSKVTS